MPRYALLPPSVSSKLRTHLRKMAISKYRDCMSHLLPPTTYKAHRTLDILVLSRTSWKTETKHFQASWHQDLPGCNNSIKVNMLSALSQLMHTVFGSSVNCSNNTWDDLIQRIVLGRRCLYSLKHLVLYKHPQCIVWIRIMGVDKNHCEILSVNRKVIILVGEVK